MAEVNVKKLLDQIVLDYKITETLKDLESKIASRTYNLPDGPKSSRNSKKICAYIPSVFTLKGGIVNFSHTKDEIEKGEVEPADISDYFIGKDKDKPQNVYVEPKERKGVDAAYN